MFSVDWFRGRWHKLKTDTAFWLWQRSLWAAHKRETKKLFATGQLQSDCWRLSRELRDEAEARFAPPKARAEAKRAALEAELNSFKHRAALFTRNFKAELDEAHGRLKPIQAEIAEAYQAKEEPRERLHDAKDYLDHWHSRAESSFPLYGKKGRPIPRHNLFGISTAKKERAEDAKYDAISELKAIDRWLGPLLNQREEIRTAIRQIKADRTSFNQLLSEGVSMADARRDVQSSQERYDAQVKYVRAIGALRRRLERSSPLALRIQRIEQEIAERLAAKKAALEAFWEPKAVRERQRTFHSTRAANSPSSRE